MVATSAARCTAVLRADRRLSHVSGPCVRKIKGRFIAGRIPYKGRWVNLSPGCAMALCCFLCFPSRIGTTEWDVVVYLARIVEMIACVAHSLGLLLDSHGVMTIITEFIHHLRSVTKTRQVEP